MVEPEPSTSLNFGDKAPPKRKSTILKGEVAECFDRTQISSEYSYQHSFKPLSKSFD